VLRTRVQSIFQLNILCVYVMQFIILSFNMALVWFKDSDHAIKIYSTTGTLIQNSKQVLKIPFSIFSDFLLFRRGEFSRLKLKFFFFFVEMLGDVVGINIQLICFDEGNLEFTNDFYWGQYNTTIYWSNAQLKKHSAEKCCLKNAQLKKRSAVETLSW